MLHDKSNWNPNLELATIEDYPTIQNMARFYAYDMSRECGFQSDEWAFPKDGLYESHDLKKYFIDDSRKAFLIKIANELAGFVLINKNGVYADTQWNMGEFFIVAKYQEKGLGKQVAKRIWQDHLGKWEVSVMLENKKSLGFWRNVINHYTKGKYHEEIKEINYDKHQPKRYIFTFESLA